MWSCGVAPVSNPAKWVCSGVDTILRPPRVVIAMPFRLVDR
jgi:hypothetical protein